VALWSCFGEAALECKKALQVYDLQGFFCVLADRASAYNISINIQGVLCGGIFSSSKQ